MYDVVRNGKQRQDDYTRIKKTIQEIVGVSKSKKKKEKKQTRNENLEEQFLAFQEFQKTLVEATFRAAEKNKKTAKFEDVRSDSDNGTMSSCYNSRTFVGKSNAKERAKREEYNTDELSDTLSSDNAQLDRCGATEGTNSGESDAEIASYNSEKESKASSGSDTNGTTQIDSSCVQRFKKKSVLSPSELAIIKDLCRDLIKKDEKPTEETELKQEPPDSKDEQKYDKEVCSEKESEKSINSEESTNSVQINIESPETKMQQESIEDQRDIIETEITNVKNYNIELEEVENLKNKPITENTPIPKRSNVESLIYDSSSNEETPESYIEQKTHAIYDNEELMDTLLVKGKLTMISEHKEETVTTNKNFEMVHLEILTKETVEEVDDWKKWSEEKIVIEKTVKVNGENNDITEMERKMEEETNEAAQCNMSDDDLIRKTMIEMEQIDQEFMIEKASPVVEHQNCHCTCAGDGHKQMLEERINLLQEQIFFLKEQLEAAKRQNEEEAKEVEYLSAMMAGRGSSLRNGLDWDEWELKEMVRERMEQKRLAAMQEYQAKLGVVEALCSAEMGKLQESLETLLPLNAAASAWDYPSEAMDIRPSGQAQDYVFEVMTSINLSSSDENGVSGTISTNCEEPSLTEWKAEGQ